MCIKTETGGCQGCEIFRVGTSMIKNSVPYQEVVREWWHNQCPAGQKPNIYDTHCSTGLKTLVIEQEIIK